MRVMERSDLERGEVKAFAQHVDANDHATGPLPHGSDRRVPFARPQRVVDHLRSKLGSEPRVQRVDLVGPRLRSDPRQE